MRGNPWLDKTDETRYHEERKSYTVLVKITTPNGTSYTPVCDMENIDEQATKVPYQGYIVWYGFFEKISTGKIFIWQRMKSLPDKSTEKTHMQKFSARIFEKSTSRIRSRGLQLVPSALDH
mgnify:CR=1 FL=1